MVCLDDPLVSIFNCGLFALVLNSQEQIANVDIPIKPNLSVLQSEILQ